jgi:hypothetical protein
VEEALRVIRNTLNIDSSFPERSSLQVENVMELLDTDLTTTYFKFEDAFYQQKEGKEKGNSLSPVVSNIFREHSDDTADHKPAKSLRYVEDTFVVWPYEPASLQKYHHLNRVRPINFRLQVETSDDKSKIGHESGNLLWSLSEPQVQPFTS